MIAAQEAFALPVVWMPDYLQTVPLSLQIRLAASNRTEYYMHHLLTGTDIPVLEDVQYHDGGAVTALVASALGIKRHIRTISTACSSWPMLSCMQHG